MNLVSTYSKCLCQLVSTYDLKNCDINCTLYDLLNEIEITT